MSPFCLFHGIAGRCHVCTTPWTTAEATGILHSFYHSVSSPTRFRTQRVALFIPESTAVICIYFSQMNFLSKRIPQLAFFPPRKPPSTMYVGSNPAVQWQSEVIWKKGNDLNKLSDFCPAESENCIRKHPFTPHRKSFISVGLVKPHKGKL